MLLDQFIQRRKTYQIIWTVGLFLFFLAAFSQFLGTSNGWVNNTNYYRLWYLCGAMGTSSFLGMGTIFLIAPRKLAIAVLGVLLVAFITAAVLVFSSSVDLQLLPSNSTQEVTGKAFPTYVRVITPIFNIFGAGFLAFGALQSAWMFWRKRIKLYRVFSNIFIAAGAFAASSAGIITRFNLSSSDAFSLATLLGVTLIFIGFLISIEIFEEIRVPFTKILLKRRQSLKGEIQ
jgi:hypothetical protein